MSEKMSFFFFFYRSKFICKTDVMKNTLFFNLQEDEDGTISGMKLALKEIGLVKVSESVFGSAAIS